MTETGRASNWFTPLRFGVLLALLIFAAFPQVVLGLQTFVARDFGFFGYPLASFQRECFWHGEIPLWDPYNYCGAPFLAQWNTMPLYPLSLVYLVFPLTWSLGFFCLLHLWLAGMGMYFLARRWTGNSFAAAFAGTVFAFNGFTLNLIMWPSHLATFAWMPWVVLAVELAWREGGAKIFLAALAGACQMLAGGPEIICFTWLVLSAFWVQQIMIGEAPRRQVAWRFPLIIVLVAALAAIQLLPFLDLVAHSQRNLTYLDTRWSLPLRGWANFFVPVAFGGTWDMGVFYQYEQEWTSSYYLGIVTLWLAVLALWKTGGRRVGLLAIILVAAIILALGENTAVLPALRRLVPQIRLITHSIKYLAVAIFVLPLLAAFALDRLQRLPPNLKVQWRTPFFVTGAVLLALVGIVLLWAWKFPFSTDDAPRTLINGLCRAVFAVVAGGLLFVCAWSDGTRRPWLWSLALIAVVWLDLFTHEPTQNPTASPSIYAPGLADEKLALNPQPSLGRSRLMVTAPAFHASLHFAIRPQENYLVNRLAGVHDVNLLDHVPKVDGFLSLLPREADDVNTLLYTTNAAAVPRLEDFMGVSHTNSSEKIYEWLPRESFLPLVTAGQKPYFFDDYSAWRALADPKFDGAKLVLLPEAAQNAIAFTNQTEARVLGATWRNDQVDIDVDAATPSMVVIAQTYYHNWRATVDGSATPLWRANYAFQAVQVPAGRHHLGLRYRDRAFQLGAILSLTAFAACLAGLVIGRKKI